MKPGEWGTPSSEHEAVYHATSRCQAASLSLTPRRLHSQKKACSVEGKKTGGFASQERTPLSRFAGMESLCLLKGNRSIGLVGLEHGEQNACPNVGEGSDSHAMAFAFRSFALIIGFGPPFLLGARLRKLMQRIAQGLNTPQTSMGLGVGPASKQDRRGATQGLHTGGAFIARRVISNFSQQARSKTLACSGQATEDLVVSMAQKSCLISSS